MKNLKLFQHIFILCSLSVLLQNCKRDLCKGKDLSTITINNNVSDTDKMNVPFKGDDTLVYIGNNGDTSYLFGKGITKGYEYETSGNGYSDCPKRTEFYSEYLEYKFEGNDSLFLIKYKLYCDINNKDFMAFRFNNIESGSYPDFLNNDSIYFDSVTINGKIYYGKLRSYNNFIFLFNYKFGFLMLKFNNGNTYKLNL